MNNIFMYHGIYIVFQGSVVLVSLRYYYSFNIIKIFILSFSNLFNFFLFMYVYMHLFIYLCVCVCVCVFY